MTESWEEKTERLEREYQARIDRLREELREARDIAGVVATNVREIGDGAMAQLKSDNAALTKRLAELEATTRERLIRVRELGHETMSWSKKVDTETYWQTGLRELEIQNAALTKRVAELEGVVESKEKLQAWLEKTLTEANSRITNLTIDFLSQLEAKDKRVAELEARDASRDESKLHSRNVLEKRVAELERDNTRMKNAEVVRGHTEEFSRQLLAELDEVKAAKARLLGVNQQLCKEMSEIREQIADLQSQLAWTPVSAGLPTEPGLYLFTCRGDEKLYTITEGKFLEHTDNGTDPWDASAMRYWTNYRRIELPKDGES